MIDYLRTIFGEDIKQESFQYPVGTPNYIRNGYKAWCFSRDGQKCVVLKPVSASWRLPGVKKQFRNFKSLSDLPCVLCFDRLTSAQRKNLMQEKYHLLLPDHSCICRFGACILLKKIKQS